MLKKKNKNQNLIEKFLEVLDQEEIELEKYRTHLSTWDDIKKREKHYKLDQLKCLIKYLNKQIDLVLPVLSSIDEITDFELIQEMLEKLEEQEQTSLLAWYLTQFHNFFKNNENCKIYANSAGSICLRAEICELQEDLKDLNFYKNQFIEIQNESLLMMYHKNNDINRSKSILRKWKIKEQYIQILVPELQIKEQKEVKQRNHPINKTDNLSKEDVYKAKQELHKYYQNQQLLKYLNKEELERLKQYLRILYNKQELQKIMKDLTHQNQILQERKRNELRKSILNLEQEEIYQKAIKIDFENDEQTNPYYQNIIRISLKEIGEIIENLLEEQKDEDSNILKEMLLEEIEKIKNAYIYLYGTGLQIRKREE